MTRIFIKKGLLLSVYTALLSSILFWFLTNSLWYLIPNWVLLYWLGFFSTMSFSGYTMDTSPNNIKAEFGRFTVLNLILLIISVILYVCAFILEVLIW